MSDFCWRGQVFFSIFKSTKELIWTIPHTFLFESYQHFHRPHNISRYIDCVFNWTTNERIWTALHSSPEVPAASSPLSWVLQLGLIWSWHIGYRIAFRRYRRKFWWFTIIFAISGELPDAFFLRITYIFAIESDIFVALIVAVLSAMPIAISGELPGAFFCDSLIFSP